MSIGLLTDVKRLQLQWESKSFFMQLSLIQGLLWEPMLMQTPIAAIAEKSYRSRPSKISASRQQALLHT